MTNSYFEYLEISRHELGRNNINFIWSCIVRFFDIYPPRIHDNLILLHSHTYDELKSKAMAYDRYKETVTDAKSSD